MLQTHDGTQGFGPAAPDSFATLHPEQPRQIHDLLAASSPQDDGDQSPVLSRLRREVDNGS
jgi:hypothetical protein